MDLSNDGDDVRRQFRFIFVSRVSQKIDVEISPKHQLHSILSKV